MEENYHGSAIRIAVRVRHKCSITYGNISHNKTLLE